MSALSFVIAALIAAPTPTTLLDPPPAGLPAATRWQLGNGLRVVFIENRAAPWLEVRLGVRVGSASDPVGKEGLASLTGALLTTGVPGRDEQQIAEDLARMGASLEVEVEPESLVVSGQVLTLDPAAARRFMDLVADVALRATLPEDALQRHKALKLAGIRNLVDNPAAICQVAAIAAALPGRPEGRASFGTLTSVATIGRDDVVAWRDRALSPAHAVLVVAGNLDPKAMLAWVERRFADWGAGTTCERGQGALPGTCTSICKDGACLANPTATPRPRATIEGTPAREVVLIAMDDPNMEQVEWRLAAANPFPVMDPSWGAIRLATHVLGGEFTSRLNRVLREQEGLTYGAYFVPDFGGWQSGVMAVTTDATPAALGKSIGLGTAMWDTMEAELVPAEELEASRLTLVNGFPFRFETVSHVLEQYTFVELADIPYSYLARWKDAVSAFGPEDVRQSMKAARSVAEPVLVVVGPESVAKTLEAFGAVRVVKVLDFLTSGLSHPP